MTAQTQYHAGLEAERSVARHYLRSGYEFVQHRYLGESGEIDLIMRHGASLVFVEVKKSRSHARAAERLGPKQIERIYRSASEFLEGEPAGQNTPARFDVALVNGTGEVEIVENAFSA